MKLALKKKAHCTALCGWEDTNIQHDRILEKKIFYNAELVKQK